MNALSSPRSRPRGYFLIEAMIYITLLSVITGLAFVALGRALGTSRDLTRNADDIARALKAGEQWRADIRAASSPPRKIMDENNPAQHALEIDRADGAVAYFFDGAALWRKEGEQPARLFLERVKASDMAADDRAPVAAWRWELELESLRKVVRIRPLFTFQAVPAASAQP